jgi:hypothetical protein
MNRRTATLFLTLCMVGAWAPTHAQNVDTVVVRFPQDVIYKGLAGTPQHATLFGDSSQPGLYVDRIRFLPGTKVMPHWHPDAVRTVLIRHILLRRWRTMGREQAKGLSRRHVIFRTPENAALCMG